MSSGILAALLTLATPSHPQNASELGNVLQSAVAYVAQYEAELGNLIGTEEYVQNAVWQAPTTRGNTTVAKRLQRRVSSDFLIIQVGPERQAIRKVNRVDGVKVKDTEPPFEEAFDDSPQANQKRLDAMRGESTQYNIGDIIRDINLPTVALKVLHQSEFPRFSFERAGTSKVEGVETWRVRFREQTGPTLVTGLKGELLYSNGTLWIEPGTGRVLQTEFNVENQRLHVKARVIVAFSEGKTVRMLVPSRMYEKYESEYNTVDCQATYSNFRPFEVNVQFEIHPPVQ